MERGKPPIWSRRWFYGLLIGISIAIISYLTAGFFGKLGGDLAERGMSWVWPSSDLVSIQLTTQRACLPGDVNRIVSERLGGGVRLADGAERMRICLDGKLSTAADTFGKDMASLIPGCLAYESGQSARLRLLARSGAVCETPFVTDNHELKFVGYEADRARIVLCIGSKAKQAPPVAYIAASPRHCSPEELAQYEFPPH